MSDAPFGDYEADDAFDLEPPDPEQVARKLHQLRRREGFEIAAWEDLTAGERLALIAIIATLLAWLRRQGGLR